MYTITTLGNLRLHILPSTQYLHVYFNQSSNGQTREAVIVLNNLETCRKLAYNVEQMMQRPPQMSRNCGDASKTHEQSESRVH